jgi:flagellar biosynthetic protein FliP
MAHVGHAAQKSHFWRHFAEMIVAMLLGMIVLGVPFRAILGGLGYTWDEAVERFPAVICVVMTFDMAVGMVAWMRFRGHAWRACAEMTVAMYVATAITLGMFWLHIIPADMLIGWLHILMVPAMLFAMLYRHDGYAYAHH